MSDERVETIRGSLNIAETWADDIAAAEVSRIINDARSALYSLERELEGLRAERAAIRSKAFVTDWPEDVVETLSGWKTELFAAQEVVEAGKGLRDWAGCTKPKHFLEGCPDDCEEHAAIQRWDTALSHFDEVTN